MCRNNNELYWLNDIKQNVIEFFVKFSRFEYALRSNEYCETKGANIIVKTDFIKFANQYKNVSLPEELINFVKYLDDNPVGKLTSDKSYIKNKETSKSELYRLVMYLTRIRNNLFHGVKYPNLEKYEKESRGTKLINLGIKAVDFLVTIDSKIETTYRG